MQTRVAVFLTTLVSGARGGWVLTRLDRARPSPGFYPIVSAVVVTGTLTVTALALSIEMFLAFSRHRVLNDLTSWWIGMGFSALIVAVLFRFVSFPIGPSDPAVLRQPASS